jgi:hypothetical protein
MEVREKLYQRPGFNEFLEETSKNPESGTSLDNTLIQPMQRITRYPLLLRELLKYTPEDHEDHERVKEAMEMVGNIVNDIERTRDQAENINKMREIRNKFVEVNHPLFLLHHPATRSLGILESSRACYCWFVHKGRSSEEDQTRRWYHLCCSLFIQQHFAYWFASTKLKQKQPRLCLGTSYLSRRVSQGLQM